MAEEDLSLEDPKEESENEKGESTGSKKKLIIIAAAAATVLLIAGGAAAYFLFMGDDAINPNPVAESEITEVDGESEEAAKPIEVVPPPPPKGDAIYISVPEPFLVNIKSGKRTRMMQIKIQFMVRSKDAEKAVKLHMPLIRNNILDFFSTADANEVRTKEGRDALKDGAFEAAKKVVKEQVGFDAIEMVLFTGFVVQ
ncbi:MAG: flagellar basal body-associated protein FliL [Gammaproteobacteria bacterium]|nr:flagellar basal body-associated protein FliL [Gammaproteobacteria bacterium]